MFRLFALMADQPLTVIWCQILFIHIGFLSEWFVTFLNKPKLTCLHTVKRFQVLLSNTNNSTWNLSLVWFGFMSHQHL